MKEYFIFIKSQIIFRSIKIKLLRIFLRILTLPILDFIYLFVLKKVIVKKKIKNPSNNFSYKYLNNLNPEYEKYSLFFEKELNNSDKKSIKHFRFLSYNTNKKAKFNEPDFIIPLRIHKHGWLVADIIKIKNSNNKEYYSIIINKLNKWKKIYPIGYGLPYVLSITISQRIIHWSFALMLLESNSSIIAPEKEKLINQLIKYLIDETSYLLIRGTFFNKIKNNFFVSEAVSLIIAFEVLNNYHKRFLIIDYIDKKIKRELDDFLSNRINAKSFVDEGSIFYENFILENLSLLESINFKKYDKYKYKLFIYIYSISKNNKQLPNVGDSSYEHALEIYDYKSNNFLKKDILNVFFNSKGKLNKNNFKIKNLFNKYNKKSGDLTFSFFSNHTVIQNKEFYFLIDHENVPSKGKNGGHAHQDLSSYILDYKKELIVNSGTYTYNEENIRNNFRSQNYHNLPIIEGFQYGKLTNKFFISDYPYCKIKREKDNRYFKISILITNLYNNSINKIEKNTYLKRSIILDTNSKNIEINDSYSTKRKRSNFKLKSFIHLHPNINYRIGNKKINLYDENASKIAEIEIESSLNFEFKEYLYSGSYGEKLKSKKIVISSTNKKIKYKIVTS